MAKLFRFCQSAQLIRSIRVVKDFIVQVGQLTVVSKSFLKSRESTLETP